MNTIKTVSNEEFLDRFMKSGSKLKKVTQHDYGKFFIAPVEVLIKLSKLPVPPTRATTHTLLFLTSGVATMKVGFHSVKIKANELISVAAGQVFSYDKYEVNTGFICVFDRNFLINRIGNNQILHDPEFLTLWGNPIVRPDRSRATYIAQTFQRLHDEYVTTGLNNISVVRAYLAAVLSDLEVSYKPLSKSSSKSATQLTNKFKALLATHIRTTQLVRDYASLLHVTPNHLTKVVREASGKSPSKWIDETLMLEAKVLLAQTSLSIQQVADELGMEDQSYFSRMFRKYEGTTPIGFRKMIEKS